MGLKTKDKMGHTWEGLQLSCLFLPYLVALEIGVKALFMPGKQSITKLPPNSELTTLVFTQVLM